MTNGIDHLGHGLSESLNISQNEARDILRALFNSESGIISNALARGERVQITGFGTFEVRRRKMRTGRNPRTGEKIRIPAARTLNFRAGKGLKDAVNE